MSPVTWTGESGASPGGSTGAPSGGVGPAGEPGSARTSPGVPLRIGLLGCGNVGAAFVALVDGGSEAIARRTGIELEITRIAVRHLDRARPGAGDRAGLERRLTTDPAAVVTAGDVDLVVELMGGTHPAGPLVLAALAAKKPVVSANKELLATSGRELSAAAEAAGVDLLFEASVAGAIPLVRLLRDSLAGEQIGRLTGIVNGTTNYMLTRMSDEGLGYPEALSEAQALGYAEADPTADVEGFDSAAKAAILAGVAFDADVVASDVHREGISGLQRSDIEFAHRLGYEVKLLAIVERVSSPDPGRPGVAVRVHPAMVRKDHPLSSIRGPFNAVFVEGDAVGELMVYGRGAGGKPTASAVLGDVIDAAHHLREGSRGRSSLRHPADLRPISELHSQYYLTLDVADRPGVLAAVASVFGEHRVSIRSMEQVGLAGEARLVFITHTALEADLQATLGELASLEAVERHRERAEGDRRRGIAVPGKVGAQGERRGSPPAVARRHRGVPGIPPGRRVDARRDPARGRNSSAPCPPPLRTCQCGGVAEDRGGQPDGILQGPRHDRGHLPGGRGRCRSGRVRLHREHVCFGGCLRRPRRHELRGVDPGGAHRARQARPGPCPRSARAADPGQLRRRPCPRERAAVAPARRRGELGQPGPDRRADDGSLRDSRRPW